MPTTTTPTQSRTRARWGVLFQELAPVSGAVHAELLLGVAGLVVGVGHEALLGFVGHVEVTPREARPRHVQLTVAANGDLLQILACPESHQPLSEASADELAALNARIEGKSVKNKGGEDVTEKLEAALIREDKQVLYPIREGIPVLLVDEGIAVAG